MKKIFALALAAMMALAAFAGCSNGNSAKDDSFVIGGIGPLTGDYATYGVSVKQARSLQSRKSTRLAESTAFPLRCSSKMTRLTPKWP